VSSINSSKGDTTMIQVPMTDIDDYDLLGKEYELTVKNSTTTINEWFPIFTGDKASCLDEGYIQYGFAGVLASMISLKCGSR
jgi:hypothetical protein